MPIEQLLASTQHRPYPLPDKPWVMTQTWKKLLFAHWPVPPELLRPLLPEKLELDEFNNQAWIGVIPFTMDNIRLRGLPKIPYTSAFHELNVRTYVKVGNKRGVYFFSLDATHRFAVEAARILFHLPYMYAHIHMKPSSAQGTHYNNQRQDRRSESAQFIANYQPVSLPFTTMEGTLENWLTERYCLYTTNKSGLIMRGDIHHQPWDLQNAAAEVKVNSMITAAGLPQPMGEPLLHYAEYIEVLIWGLVEAEV